MTAVRVDFRRLVEVAKEANHGTFRGGVITPAIENVVEAVLAELCRMRLLEGCREELNE